MTPTGGKSSTVRAPLPGLKATLLPKKLRSTGYKCLSDFNSGSAWVQEIFLVLLKQCPWVCDGSQIPAHSHWVAPKLQAPQEAWGGGTETGAGSGRLCALLPLRAQGQGCPFQTELET